MDLTMQGSMLIPLLLVAVTEVLSMETVVGGTVVGVVLCKWPCTGGKNGKITER